MTRSIPLICAALTVPWALAAAQGGAAATSEGDQLLAMVKKEVGPKGPTRVFKLYATPTRSNFRYRIDVCDADGGRVLQSEEIRNGVALKGDKEDFQVTDADGDGYLDIKVLGGTRDGQVWYKIWVYDRERKRFVWSTRDH